MQVGTRKVKGEPITLSDPKGREEVSFLKVLDLAFILASDHAHGGRDSTRKKER